MILTLSWLILNAIIQYVLSPNPFSLEKLTFREILNGHISKTSTNSELKLKFSEGSFSVVIFCALYARGYTEWCSVSYNSRRRCQWFTGLKGSITSQEKFWICFLQFVSFGTELNLARCINKTKSKSLLKQYFWKSVINS